MGPGIGNVELGYYDSRADRDGDDPTVRNSELRLLLGYEQDIARNLTLGLQYYLERYTSLRPTGGPCPLVPRCGTRIATSSPSGWPG